MCRSCQVRPFWSFVNSINGLCCNRSNCKHVEQWDVSDAQTASCRLFSSMFCFIDVLQVYKERYYPSRVLKVGTDSLEIQRNYGEQKSRYMCFRNEI